MLSAEADNFIFDSFGIFEKQRIVIRTIFRVMLRRMDDLSRKIADLPVQGIHLGGAVNMKGQMVQCAGSSAAWFIAFVRFPLVDQAN